MHNSLEDLIDCFSLATGTISDSIICMTDQGQQLNEEVFQALIEQPDDQDTEDVVRPLRGGM